MDANEASASANDKEATGVIDAATEARPDQAKLESGAQYAGLQTPWQAATYCVERASSCVMMRQTMRSAIAQQQ